MHVGVAHVRRLTLKHRFDDEYMARWVLVVKPRSGKHLELNVEGQVALDVKVRTKSVSTPGQSQSCSRSSFIGGKTPSVFAVVLPLAATNAAGFSDPPVLSNGPMSISPVPRSL